jgi:DNA polymerase
MTKKERLKKLNEEMLACKKCELRKTCTQVVPGEGSANAEIVFIGEGPGKKEDELGRPFVGAAGKFLDEMLASAKLKREDVYIANTVKCRPPNNRDPLVSEKETCWPWLERQIDVIKPRVIVTLGRHSMNLFLPEEKISEAHGKMFKKDFFGTKKQAFFCLYHPAAALYNGGMRQTLIDDFKKINKLLKKLDS